MKTKEEILEKYKQCGALSDIVDFDDALLAMEEYAQEQLKNCNLQNVSFSLPNEGEIQKLYKDEMKKRKGTSWHTELEYHCDLFVDGARAVVAYLKGNES